MNDNEQHAPDPYAGRWVARLRGHIVAQAGTPEQALRVSQSARYKEKPEIAYIPMDLQIHPLVQKIREIIPAKQTIYLVGGAVRDMLLNRLSPDLDFALPSGGIAIARKVAAQLNANFMVLDEERDTGRVIASDEDGTRIFLDFAAYRAGSSLEADLRARDFTINALAFDLHANSIFDPLDGANDIRAKLIRACAPSSLEDDPLRILRAIRLAASLGFQIDKSTREWMKQSVASLPQASVERVRDELFKILGGPKPDVAMRALEMLGVFPYTLPEIASMKGVEQSAPHVYDVWNHTLAVLGALDDLISSLRIGYDAEQTNDMYTGVLSLRLGRYREQFAQHFANPLNPDRSTRSLLFFASLYHDVCKPETKFTDENGRIRFFDHDIRGANVVANRARFFNLSTDEEKRLSLIVRNHMRMHSFANRMLDQNQPPSRKAIYRFFRDAEGAGIDLVLLALADVRGTYAANLSQERWTAYADIARMLLENYWEKPHEVVYPPRLLDGNELMKELGIPPGPVVGRLLELIRENQAAGKIETREQAVAFAREEYHKEDTGAV